VREAGHDGESAQRGAVGTKKQEISALGGRGHETDSGGRPRDRGLRLTQVRDPLGARAVPRRHPGVTADQAGVSGASSATGQKSFRSPVPFGRMA
jgi:hypothetical protein